MTPSSVYTVFKVWRQQLLKETQSNAQHEPQGNEPQPQGVGKLIVFI